MTDQEIYDQTNTLAGKFYQLMGYIDRPGFDYRTSTHPQERLCWDMACAAQEELVGTEIENVLEELELDD